MSGLFEDGEMPFGNRDNRPRVIHRDRTMQPKPAGNRPKDRKYPSKARTPLGG